MWKVCLGILAFIAASLSGVYAGDGGLEAKSKALAHYIVAVAHDFNDQPEAAVIAYERAIEYNGQEVSPRLRLAADYTRSGRLDQAIKQLKTVLAIDPANSKARYLLGLVYSAQKKYDLAAKEYEGILKSAAKDSPDNLEIHIYLAQLYFSQEKYQDAAAQFKYILETQPDNVSANYFLGTSYLELGDRDKAKGLFNKVLSLEPDHDGALNAMAYMYAEEGVNLDDALKMARSAIAIDGSNGAYYDTLGWVLFKKGMNAESLMALQKSEMYIQDPTLYDHMGDVYHALKEFSLARKAWRRSLELKADQPQVQTKIEDLGKTQARQ